MFFSFTIDDITTIFYKKNSLVIEGKRSSIVSSYNFTHCESSIYSDRFKAIWHYIINNIENNESIYRIKETHSNFQSSCNYNENCKKCCKLCSLN